MKLSIIVAILTTVMVLATGCITIVTNGTATSGGTEVTVNAQGARNVGSLEFELVYDPAVLEAVEVKKDELAHNAMLESSISRPGRVWVGMVDSDGINGNGSLAVVSFRAVGQGATASQITVENIKAHNAGTLIDIITQTTAGNIGTSPVIIFIR